MTAQLAQSLPEQIEALQALLLKREQRINLLEEQLRLLKHQRFGKSSEQSDRQAELFNEAEAGDTAEDDAEDDTADAPTETITYQRTTRPRRKPLPADLPRVRIEHDLPEAEKVCACGCQLSPIGEATSEQLDIIPATIRVLVHARRKYACKRCESSVKTAPLPKQPLPKSNASAGLLAQVATAKYQDALPLHRQEAIFRRIGVDLPRNTLAQWMLRCGELIAPLIGELDRQLRASRIIQCDETPVQVLKEADKPPASRSCMWMRVGGDRRQPIVRYDYAPAGPGRWPKPC